MGSVPHWLTARPNGVCPRLTGHGHEKTPAVSGRGLRIGGGYRDRTDDLLNAIQTLSQLS
jgi:hypothetical protein